MGFIEIRTPEKFTNPDGLIKVPNLSAGLVADLDADVRVGTGAGGTVTSWGDVTGTLTLDATATTDTTRPTLVENAVNGHRVVRFNGGQSLTSTVHPTLLESGAAGTIAIAYFDTGTGDNNRRLVVSANSQVDYRWLRSYRGQFQAGGSVGAGFQSSTVSNSATGKWVIGVALFDGTTVTLRTSTGDTATGEMIPGELAGLLLGSSASGSDKLAGDIARVMVWNRTLDEDETDGVIGLLADRYGIA